MTIVAERVPESLSMTGSDQKQSPSWSAAPGGVNFYLRGTFWNLIFMSCGYKVTTALRHCDRGED